MDFKFWIYRVFVWRSFYGNRIRSITDTISVTASLIILLVVIYQIGFDLAESYRLSLNSLNRKLLLFCGIFYIFRLVVAVVSGSKVFRRDKVWLLLMVLLCTAGAYLPSNFNILTPTMLHYTYLLLLLVVALFEISRNGLAWLSREVSPTWLFAGSFVFIILVGAGLLMLPRSSNVPVSFLQALFTSTSAVCVTGLTVVDIDVVFSPFGHFIILILIQLGGLGVMTFTSFFAMYFSGQSSFQNQLVLKEVVSADSLGSLFRTIRQIVIVTFVIEAVGAWSLYHSLTVSSALSGGEAVWASIFHSVSAFCNAGFSIYHGNLANTLFAHNHWFLITICMLIIVGGIGFPLQANLIALVRYQLNRLYSLIINNKTLVTRRSHVVTVNSRLVMVTTLILLVAGTAALYVSEYNSSLSGMTLTDRLVNSFFWAVTPRTAGFNAIDMGALSKISVMVIILLMWIGASPMSTGGGIKTTTLAMAWLNMKSVLMQEEHIDVNRRQIENQSVMRAFAVIFISLLVLGISSMMLKLLEPDKPVVSLIFECCSALSTVGLSLNLTPSLGSASQVVLIMLMFIGRIGILSFAMTFWNKRRFKGYSYPREYVMV